VNAPQAAISPSAFHVDDELSILRKVCDAF